VVEIVVAAAAVVVEVAAAAAETATAGRGLVSPSVFFLCSSANGHFPGDGHSASL
jgi:hypothetical protein